LTNTEFFKSILL